jgi:hypothetical protein
VDYVLDCPYSYLYELGRAIKVRKYVKALRDFRQGGLLQGGKAEEIEAFLDELKPPPRKGKGTKHSTHERVDDEGFVIS